MLYRLLRLGLLIGTIVFARIKLKFLIPVCWGLNERIFVVILHKMRCVYLQIFAKGLYDILLPLGLEGALRAGSRERLTRILTANGNFRDFLWVG